jgi:membrane protein DedA with SNARE-associated domain
MIEIITNLMLLNLYIAVFLLIFIENIFPPIPSELVLTYAGSLALINGLNIYLLIFIATASSVLSSLLFYYIGSKFKIDQILKLNSKLKKFGFKPSDIENSYNKFSKNDRTFVFFSRLIPVMRSLVSIPAGSVKMPLSTFIIYTFFGSLIWNSALITFGYFFSEQITNLVNFMSIYQNIIFTLLIIYIVYKLLKKG